MPKVIDRNKALPLIYAEVAAGKSLNSILGKNGLPAATTFWRWHMEDEEIRDNLARARLNGVEVHLDEALSIADTPVEGRTVTRKLDKDGNEYDEVRTEDMLGHRKLQIETRIKRAQMMAPRKYGPKLDMTSDGERLQLAAIIAERRERLAGD